MRIPQETLDQIKARIDIVDVVGGYVTYDTKRSTKRDRWACCPFHLEKTPSFKVDALHGFFKCFGGCDAKGDAVAFLRRKLGVTYMEAMELLAHKYGIPWEPTGEGHTTEEERVREGYYLLLAQAQTYYREQLDTPAGAGAREYLAGRGITEELIDTFGLGYSIDGWRAWHDEALRQGYSVGQLLATGMVIKKEEGTAPYDRFRGRLMVPLYNLSGKVVGFGARKLEEGAAGPKYLNSPETVLYQKGGYLYGLYQARLAIRGAGHAYLVEGYTDIFALHRVGLGQAVASAGTSLTAQQLHTLGRFTKQVVLLFDGDLAGQHAADRGIDLLLDQGFDVKVVTLPGGQDPAGYAEADGDTALREHLERGAQDFITYLVQRLLHETEGDPAGQAEGVTALLRRIARIPDVVRQQVYLGLCSRLLGLEMKVLSRRLESLAQEVAWQPVTAVHRAVLASTTQGQARQERDLLYLLLTHGMEQVTGGGRLGDYLLKELATLALTTPSLQAIARAFKEAWEVQEGITAHDFIQGQPVEVQEEVIDIMTPLHAPSSAWYSRHQVPLPGATDGLLERSYKAVQRLKLRMVQRLLTESRKKIEVTAPAGGELDELLTIHAALQALQREVAVSLGMTLIPHYPTTTTIL